MHFYERLSYICTQNAFYFHNNFLQFDHPARFKFVNFRQFISSSVLHIKTNLGTQYTNLYI